jgi:hypothetical protein
LAADAADTAAVAAVTAVAVVAAVTAALAVTAETAVLVEGTGGVAVLAALAPRSRNEQTDPAFAIVLSDNTHQKKAALRSTAQTTEFVALATATGNGPRRT